MSGEEGMHFASQLIMQVGQSGAQLIVRLTGMGMRGVGRTLSVAGAGIEHWRQQHINTGEMTIRRLQHKASGDLHQQDIDPEILKSLRKDLKSRGVDFAIEKGRDGQTYVHFSGRDVDTIDHAIKQVAATHRINLTDDAPAMEVTNLDAPGAIDEVSISSTPINELVVERGQIAEDATTEPQILAAMAHDDTAYVRMRVAQSENTPIATLDMLSVDEHACVRGDVANNVRTRPETLARLALDPEASVRGAVLNNPSTLPETRQQLTHDEHPSISETARSKPTGAQQGLEQLDVSLSDAKTVAPPRTKDDVLTDLKGRVKASLEQSSSAVDMPTRTLPSPKR